MNGGEFRIDETKANWKINDFFQTIESRPKFSYEINAYLNQKNYLNLVLGNIHFPAYNTVFLSINLHSKIEKFSRYRCIIRIYKLDGSYFCNRDTGLLDSDKSFKFPLFEKDEALASKKDLTRNKNLTLFFYIAFNPPENIDLPKAIPNNHLQESTSQTDFIEIPNNHLQEATSQTDFIESVDTLSKDFKELLASGRHTDVKIIVEGKEFQAHKCVLSARSAVLDSMFSQQMLENINGVVNITDCNSKTFGDFLTFLYCGKIDGITSSRMVGLYEIADKYDIQELKEECVKRFVTEMSVESVCDALCIAALHDEKDLMEKATNFFIANTQFILKSSEWDIFLKEYPGIANELFFKSFMSINLSKTV